MARLKSEFEIYTLQPSSFWSVQVPQSLTLMELLLRGAWSDSRIKTPVAAMHNLSFADAKTYLKNGKGGLYPSTSFSTFEGLSDEDCKSLFGKALPAGGVQPTGMKLGQDTKGAPIYALRQKVLSFPELGIMATRNKWDQVILVACRGQ